MAAHDHRLFTRLYGVLADLGEHSELGAARSAVLAGAHGRLLIVGLGPGHDLDHLPEAVTSVVAVEPSASMRAASLGRVVATRDRGIEVELIDAVGEHLPLPDDSVDSVLFAYSWSERLQRTVSVAGLWSRLAGGCRCDQDTRAALVEAGFHVEDLEERTLVSVPVVSWTLMGSSRP